MKSLFGEPPLTARVLIEQYAKAQSAGGRLTPWPANTATKRSAAKLVKAGKGPDVLAAIHRYAAHLLENETPRQFITRPWNWFGRAAVWETYADSASHLEPAGPANPASHLEPPGVDLERFRRECIDAARTAGIINPARYLYPETVRLCAAEILRGGFPSGDTAGAIAAVLAAAKAKAERLAGG